MLSDERALVQTSTHREAMTSVRVSPLTTAVLLLGSLLVATPLAAQVIPIHGGSQRQDQMLYAAETLEEYQRIVRTWTSAWDRGNTRELARLYRDDATLVPQGGVILQGRQEIAPVLDSLVRDRNSFRINLVEYEVRGTLFYALGSFTYHEAGNGNGGAEPVSGTVMTILQRDGRTWRIRSQIFSPAEEGGG